jgi:hypothetical protein
MHIFIDIETLPSQSAELKSLIEAGVKPPGNISKQETIDKWNVESRPAAVEAEWLKTSFDGGLGMIACISIAAGDKAPEVFYDPDWLNGEAGVIKRAFAYLDTLSVRDLQHSGRQADEQLVFVGHNLAAFDLPFLRKRCVVLGIKPPRYIPFSAKAWDKTIYDTMIQWDAKNFVGMDKLCRILGMSGKGDMDGSKVWPTVRDGGIEKVAEYCKGDVERTRALFNRMTFGGAA